MQELSWFKSHIGSMEQAKELVNEFYWNITIKQTDQGWNVRGGEKTILTTDDYDNVEAFIYGLALGYSILPEALVRQFKENLDLDNTR